MRDVPDVDPLEVGDPLFMDKCMSELTIGARIDQVGPGWLLTVDPEGDGERLDRFIARRLPRVSRSRAARLTVSVLDEQDLPTSRHLKKSTRLRVGQRLWVSRPLPPEDMSVLDEPTLLDQDQDFVVINKPPGWVAHPTASRYQSALTTWLKAQEISAVPAHRLDLETSGVVICARNRHVDVELRRAFLERSIDKTYLAFCEITHLGQDHLNAHPELWRDHTPLGFDRESQVGLKMGRGTLKAQTDFRVLHVDQDQGRVLIEARPQTGRQHQLRAHLALVGLPLVGDKLYGPSESLFLKHLEGALTAEDWHLLGHERHALHASEISLRWKGQERRWTSPLPSDLHGLISR